MTPLFNYKREIPIRQGLDLQGGIQVLLQADVTAGQAVDPDAMKAARQVIENRVNGIGVAEPLIQLGQNNRIIVELPGVRDPDTAIKTFGNTGLLEFVDAGDTPLATGWVVNTTLGPAPADTQPAPGAPPEPPEIRQKTFTTVVQGKDLASASVGFDQTTNRPEVIFSFKEEGAKAFGDFTQNNVG